jgi:DNA-binding NarL/FixJ family response regulator
MATQSLMSLTPRERDILHHLARGLSNEQIAQELVISVYTVQNHVQNIFGKLEVSNRTMAVVVAYQRGLVAVIANS